MVFMFFYLIGSFHGFKAGNLFGGSQTLFCDSLRDARWVLAAVTDSLGRQ